MNLSSIKKKVNYKKQVVAPACATQVCEGAPTGSECTLDLAMSNSINTLLVRVGLGFVGIGHISER